MSNCNLTLPNVLVIGLHGRAGKDLIDGIIGNQIIGSEFPENYTWVIDNKYYTSTVNFYDVKDYNEISSAALNTVEAILIYIDPRLKSVLEEVDQILLSFAGKCVLEKQILVVDKFEDGEEDTSLKGISKLESLNWCFTRGFELVELCYDDDENYEEKENDKDSLDSSLKGIFNIKQSLHAHCWTNLILKDKADHKNFALLPTENVINTIDADKNLKCSEVENLSNFDESDVDSFSALLTTLGDMKIKANSLPSDERKIFAEKMVISFWQSLGGGDEEIRFSNSDSE